MLALNGTSIQYFPKKDNSLATKSCTLCKFGMAGVVGMQTGDEPSQALPRQLSQGEHALSGAPAPAPPKGEPRSKACC